MPRYNPPEKKKYNPPEKKKTEDVLPPPSGSAPPIWIGGHGPVQANPGSIQENSRGLGDTVSKLIKKATMGRVKECEPCKKRKEMLNKLFPYKNNKEDKNDWS